MKRIFLFLATNILVVATISIIMSVFGVGHYVTAYGINYESLLVFCLLWGMIGSFISLLLSKFMAKMMMRVQIIDANGPHGTLVHKVHMLAQKAGIKKMPEVGIYPSREINAFATGPSVNNSLVVVSEGLLQNMSDDEIEGVLAHEIAHVANGDMVTMALVQGVVNAFVMFASRAAAFAISQALRSDDDEGPSFGGGFANMMVIFALDILFSFLAMPLIAGFSRWREYRADAGGAQLAGKQKMVSALESLGRSVELLENTEPQFNSMKISGKMKFSEFFSTHPPLQKRIQALKNAN